MNTTIVMMMMMSDKVYKYVISDVKPCHERPTHIYSLAGTRLDPRQSPLGQSRACWSTLVSTATN